MVMVDHKLDLRLMPLNVDEILSRLIFFPKTKID